MRCVGFEKLLAQSVDVDLNRIGILLAIGAKRLILEMAARNDSVLWRIRIASTIASRMGQCP